MTLVETAKKAIRNKRGYRYGDYRVEYDGKSLEVKHFGELILKFDIEENVPVYISKILTFWEKVMIARILQLFKWDFIRGIAVSPDRRKCFISHAEELTEIEEKLTAKDNVWVSKRLNVYITRKKHNRYKTLLFGKKKYYSKEGAELGEYEKKDIRKVDKSIKSKIIEIRWR